MELDSSLEVGTCSLGNDVHSWKILEFVIVQNVGIAQKQALPIHGDHYTSVFTNPIYRSLGHSVRCLSDSNAHTIHVTNIRLYQLLRQCSRLQPLSETNISWFHSNPHTPHLKPEPSGLRHFYHVEFDMTSGSLNHVQTLIAKKRAAQWPSSRATVLQCQKPRLDPEYRYLPVSSL